jgi:menaquinone-dependent protoporphyrinogen oxidase
MSAPNVLVAYATKKGSTREVAEAVASKLRDSGLRVDVCPAGEVSDAAACDGVVLGAALYMGRLHRDARKFMKKQRDVLAARPFAVFAMGPLTLSDDDVADARKQLNKGLDHAGVAPDITAVFGGVIDPAKLRFPLSRMPASDARDWLAIGAWAAQVATEISRKAVAA